MGFIAIARTVQRARTRPSPTEGIDPPRHSFAIHELIESSVRSHVRAGRHRRRSPDTGVALVGGNVIVRTLF